MSNDHKNEDEKYSTGHDYDGIKELNYPAPRWWQIIFYLSIIWGVGYFYYYELYDGETLKHRLNRELMEIEVQKSKAPQTGPTEDEFTALVSNAAAVKSGKESFMSKCASCHGDHGQGLIGPNLADSFWLYGKGTGVDIFKSVDKGIPDKGMPPWGPIMTPDEIKSVVAYVKTLQGTKPANPKAAQGVEAKP